MLVNKNKDNTIIIKTYYQIMNKKLNIKPHNHQRLITNHFNTTFKSGLHKCIYTNSKMLRLHWILHGSTAYSFSKPPRRTKINKSSTF